MEPNRELATRVHQLYTATPFELKLNHYANPGKEVGKDEEVITTEIDQVRYPGKFTGIGAVPIRDIK